MRKTALLASLGVCLLWQTQVAAYRQPEEAGPPLAKLHGLPAAPALGAARPDSTRKEATVAPESPRGRAWQRFTRKAGNWFVRWNQHTLTPHLAAGKPLSIATRQLDAANIESTCLEFISANKDVVGAAASELRCIQAVKAGGRWHVAFQQMHKGIPVLGGIVRMSFTKDDRLVAFGSDVSPDLEIDTVPALSGDMAAAMAIQDCLFDESGMDYMSGPELCVVPMQTASGLRHLLCWRLSILQSRIQKKWEYLINASSGGIVSRRNTLWYDYAHGLVRGEYKPEFASDANAVEPFPFEQVSSEGPEAVIQSWDFETDPGWHTEGAWAFGRPAGRGSHCGDPTAGATGLNVYGYNLTGDYNDSLPVQYLTTTPIDCSAYGSVRLKFQRWLGVEESWYDKADIEVSRDGTHWTKVWAHSGGANCDGRWVPVEYDISAVADYQPTVFIRWGMGPSDVNLAYPGWNIDDVEVVSMQGHAVSTHTGGDGRYSVGLAQSPAVIVSGLSGLYADVRYIGDYETRFRKGPVGPDDTIDWTWNSSLCSTFSESNVYRHINFAHDYFKALDPALTGMDYPVPVHVNGSFSNAYWDGYNIVFGRGDGIYFDDFALYAEVIYHEYAHGVTDAIYAGVDFPYAGEPGAMNEAWSDYFACLMTPSGSPLAGDGGLFIPDLNGFRSLQNNYRRETDWVNEVHDDSQMLSGALWEARAAVGGAVMDELVHFSRYAHPVTFEDCLLALLIEDDARYGDGDLSNGTPHGKAIFDAFGHHGIGGLRYAGPGIVISGDKPRRNGRLEPAEKAGLALTLVNGWADAVNIRGTLASDDPNVKIIKAISRFPNAALGQTTDNTADPFIVHIQPGCPETSTIWFTLAITADGPYKYSRTCLLYYNIAVNQLAYDDGTADGYLIQIDIGDSVAVKMTPETYPCYPTAVRIWPLWSTSIDVTVWSEGPDGGPGEVLGKVWAHPPASGDWFDVDISQLGLVINSGSIFVGWSQGISPFLNGIDFGWPCYQRSYFTSSSVWYPLVGEGWNGNFMVRMRYSDSPPLRIVAPSEYVWRSGRAVADCMSTAGGDPHHLKWIALPLPPDYICTIGTSSLFAEVGTPCNFHSDDMAFSYTLPFVFPFYGVNWTSVYISSNGQLDFTGAAMFFDNVPTLMIDGICIAPMWDDYTTFGDDDIYIDESVPGQVTIRWAAHTFWWEFPVNFAAVLFSDGRIRFDYGPENAHISPGVGISAGDGRRYIFVPGYDMVSPLGNANSVFFTPIPSRPSLPPGVFLNRQTGCLSGIPAVAGTYTATISATDGSHPRQTAVQEVAFRVE